MKTLLQNFTFVFIALISFQFSQAQNWSEIAKSLPAPHALNDYDYFGTSVAVDGNYAVISSANVDNRQGRAYVFYHDGASWIYQAELSLFDPNTIGYFGASVSISGDVIVVGAYRNGPLSEGEAYVYEKPGASWIDMTETATLSASDGLSDDYFGYTVSISGDNIVVGAWLDDDNGSGSGSAYVFTKPGVAWVDMTETAKLTATDGVASDHFGLSVGISGDNIVVGTNLDDDNGSNSGSAYVFTKPGAAWINMTETAKLLASDGATDDYFGASVAISGDNIVVGADSHDGLFWNSGAAYVFTKPGAAWINMTENAKLLPSDGALGDYFGSSVSISLDEITIGANSTNDNGLGSGSAYVFTKPGVNWVNMTETAKLLASDGATSDLLGDAVAISNGKIIGGAPRANTPSVYAGAAYAFTKPGTGWVNATENQKLTISTYLGNEGDHYGNSVAIDGNYAVIGADDHNGQGVAHVLFYDGSTWIQQAVLTPSNAGPTMFFGRSVSISGDNIVVGSPRAPYPYGKAYVYTKPGAAWADMTETAILTASDQGPVDYFGTAVSISGDNIVVGSNFDDDNGSNSGSAYVFTKPGAAWVTMTETAKLLPSDGVAGAEFGISISISGDNIVVGSSLDDDNGTSSGSAYVFTKPGAAWINMTQTAKLLASDGATNDYFGSSVAISGDNIVVGSNLDDDNGTSSGSVYVFTKPGASWISMTETGKLTASDGAANDQFGSSVSISGDNIVVGSTGDDDNGTSSGSIYFFEKPGTGWVNAFEYQKKVASDGDSYDYFGTAVAISGDLTVVGTEFDEDQSPSAGSAYLFKRCGTENAVTVSNCISYTGPSGTVYTSTGIYEDIIPNAEGCDSVTTIDFTLLPTSSSSQTFIECTGFSVTVGTNTYTTTGLYTDVLVAANGCDSTVTTDLTINVATTGTDVQTACDSYIWIDSNTYTASNNTATFTYTGGASNGCDSVVTLDLTMGFSNTATDVQTACDSYTWIDSNTYTSNNNTATFTLTNAAGCDSVVTLDLTMNFSNTGTDVQTACDSFTWIDSNTYTSNNNTATFTLTNAAGCDSVVTLDLTMNFSNTGTDVQTACDSFTWIDSNTYTSNNNTATYTLTSAAGCDSVVTLDLTILTSVTSSQTLVECDGFSVTVGTNTYTTTGIYTDVLTAVNGCDSTVTTDLTINLATTGTDVQTACDSYTWIDSNTYTTSNNTATFTLTNMAGCDSVVTLDLTINYSTTGTDVQTACDSFTWIDSNTYTSNNNTATFTLTNASGCDSVVTLDLTMNYSNTGTDVQTACGSYTWIDSNTYTSNNNTATFTVTSAAGCDSVVTLDLTILTQVGGSQTLVECDGFSVTVGTNTYSATGIYTDTLTSINGCDSIVTTDLTVHPANGMTQTLNECDGFSITVGTNTYTATGIYTDVFTDVNGCDSTITTDLTINSSTVATFTTTFGGAGLFDFVADNQGIDATYLWKIDGTTITTSSSFGWNFTTPGNYDVCLTVTENGCVDSTCQVISVTVGVNDLANNFGVSLYPNPTTGKATLLFEEPLSEKTSVIIMDITGKEVYPTQSITGKQVEVDLSELSDGVYFIQLKNEQINHSLRLVKQ